MNVGGKAVRVVESHEEVLADWAEAATELGRPLTLVTLDRHTDTTPALTADCADEDGAAEDGAEGDAPSSARVERWQRRVLSRFLGTGPERIEELVARLRNDEHIDAALRLGIVDRALIVSSQGGRTGAAEIAGAHVYRPLCAPGCALADHDSAECARRRFDAMLESDLLRPALAHLGHDLVDPPPYVLDIDLDTFATRRGLTPVDATVFHALVARARLVTIAREPEYVAESLDEHDADEIEAAVLRHVARAMAAG